tara:strand:- start:10835 stop:11197 length:363 start_codon:yes stop_codon:yes gene_type:complete
MLGETDVKDEQGNVIVQQGLKVRHKKSQFEYTVEDVVEDPKGDLTVILRMPEEPRFEPPVPGDDVLSDGKDKNSMLYEVDPEGSSIYFEPESDEANAMSKHQEELLAVPQSEFEKEYEVK